MRTFFSSTRRAREPPVSALPPRHLVRRRRAVRVYTLPKRPSDVGQGRRAQMNRNNRRLVGAEHTDGVVDGLDNQHFKKYADWILHRPDVAVTVISSIERLRAPKAQALLEYREENDKSFLASLVRPVQGTSRLNWGHGIEEFPAAWPPPVWTSSQRSYGVFAAPGNTHIYLEGGLGFRGRFLVLGDGLRNVLLWMVLKEFSPLSACRWTQIGESMLVLRS